MSLPAPHLLGLPPAFTSWRAGQVEALLKATDAPERFVALTLPTGFGKSLVYMAAAHLLAGTDGQAVILTSTIALQRQLERDFAALGVWRMQGQRAYVCEAVQPGRELAGTFGGAQAGLVTVDHGPCHLGVQCSLKERGCDYYDALRTATRARLVVTNYAWWFSLLRNPGIRLRPTLLILDEAHAAPDALADALGASLAADDIDRATGEILPKAAARSPVEWRDWAAHLWLVLARRIEGARARDRESVVHLRRVQWLVHALDRIRQIDPALLLVSDEPDGVRFDLVWAAPYAESHLFRAVPRVLLTSATLSKKTLELLGLPPRDYAYHEAGEGFPLDRRPVYILKAPRVDGRITAAQETEWLRLIDHLLRARRDRKGIIHTVSYRRRDLILARSEFKDAMLTHGRHDAAEQIRRFKDAPAGTILVSPSVTTGYDFPYTECEYQIVAKIPFPDTRDPVIEARKLIDPVYPMHLAMQNLVQASGRGMRAHDDQCETIIVDDHARWFLSKHADLAPRWFRRALRRLEVVPVPPPPLERSPRDRRGASDD